MERDVIIACDFPSKEKLAEFLEPFKGMDPYLKIGMEIFDKEGPSLVKELKEMGFHIFLDLKLHDIPNTVKSALAKLGELGVDIINIHAEGGIEMMKAAREGLNMSEAGKKTKLIAVTILTSLNDDILHNELLIDPKYSLRDVVRHYAENVKAAGLDGVVCSALEAPMMKELGREMLQILRETDNLSQAAERILFEIRTDAVNVVPADGLENIRPLERPETTPEEETKAA